MHVATGYCEGCGRLIDEIAAWSKMDDDAKWQVLEQLPARMTALAQLGVAVLDSGAGK